MSLRSRSSVYLLMSLCSQAVQVYDRTAIEEGRGASSHLNVLVGSLGAMVRSM